MGKMPRANHPTEKHEQMIQDQIIARGIHDRRVIEAMEWLPRERFFPDEIQSHAYDDAAAPIGHGQTISQPYVVALMTEALQLHPEHKVLEIGTGSGYQTAILANLCKSVDTIERIKSLLDDAFERLMNLGIRNVSYHFGDGSFGWPKNAEYDRIIITAAAPSVPEAIASQLKEGGIIVAPIGERQDQSLYRFTKKNGLLESQFLLQVRFVPLIGQGGWES